MAGPKRILICVALSAIFSIATYRSVPSGNGDDGTPDIDIFRRGPTHDHLNHISPAGGLQSPVLPEGHSAHRILVTGGGGNIGKHLVRRLLSSHTVVTVLDLIFDPEEHNYPDAARLNWINADIRNSTALDLALTPDVTGVFHLAAVSRVLHCLENEPDCIDVNERGTGAVLAAIERRPESSRPWFILASSREVYGRNQTSSAADDVPSTVYGLSKLKAENLVRRRARHINAFNTRPSHANHIHVFGKRPFHAAILRLPSVYGSSYDHSDRLVTSLVSRALAHQSLQIMGGEQEIDLLHIDDCVDAFTLAATRLERKALDKSLNKPVPDTLEIYDISGSGPVVLRHLVDKVLFLTRSKSPVQSLQQDERFPVHYVDSPDILPGYASKISLDDGLIRLVRMYLEQSVAYLKRKGENECIPESQLHVIANADLLKLNGCTANLLIDIDSEIASLAFDRNPTRPEAPHDMGPGTPDDYGIMWIVQSENIIPDPVNVTIESRDGRFFVQINAVRTYASHLLGVYSPSLPEFTPGFMFDHIEPIDVGSDRAVAEWEMIVNEADGTFKLVLPDSGFQVSPPTLSEGWFTWIPVDRDMYPFRLIPICCPASPPWPFYEQDPIQHSIHLDRFSMHRPFNKTIPQTLCLRTEAALLHARKAMDFLDQIRQDGIADRLRQMGGPAEWVGNGLITCSNDCSHPTICLDTGDCACAGSIFCYSPERFPFSSFLHSNIITYPPPSPDTANPSLLKTVEQTSWHNVLRPEAARYLGTNPSWPQVHIAVVDEASEALRGPNLESLIRLSNRDCFSADASMELALRERHISSEEADIIFQPYYHARMWTGQGDLSRLLDQLAVNYPNRPAQVVLPLTYDWGICMYFTWTIWQARRRFKIPPVLTNVIAWSVMGDLNSPCYRPHQDVLIPPRSCRTKQLRPAFSDPAYVRPVAERTHLSFFSGSLWGSGGGSRKRIICKRPVPSEGLTRLETSRLETGLGPNPLNTKWERPQSHDDYMSILNNTIFCAAPAGVAGWAPRIEDAIYAGCIPIIFDDASHLPFWELLDWKKFSVRVFTHQVQDLEHVLMSYSLQEIQKMQANLIHVRDILTYPLDNHADMVTRRSPLSFALHLSQLRLSTKWPTSDIELE
ncbi:hypothetical protein DFH07DRAFT_470062 [Mycena maculata]|uniref:Exostosin GT47 domain-containing protein n=1 Tax=Mycena maculata TaxID=230809 RepID=A0AAD7K883_9AGAR|nr:hypothetical protein DFH07DRAFT_470062 [Mycena maculata]